MKWNNIKERDAFERRQAKLKEQYIAMGMSEEQIKAMYDFDLTEFNGKRREAEHTFRLDEIDMESAIAELDCSSISRYAWIDEIEDERIAARIKKLSLTDIDLLTKYMFGGFSMTDIARTEGVSQQAISKKFKKIKSFFEKRL